MSVATQTPDQRTEDQKPEDLPPEARYSTRELEFMRAMQAHKHRTGRFFPTWAEVLEVLDGLGYQKTVTTGEAFHTRHSHLTEVQ